MERKEATHSEDPLYGASSSSTSEGNDHEVFLSFRGIDTRKGFTDHLYTNLVDAGIRVFRDSKELCVGEKMGSNLPRIVMQSKISIPIISENYASSKWCLHGLALMLECKRSRGQIVLPIFYKVEPSELKHLTGRFKDAINAHNENSNDMVLEEWKKALKEVGTLKGWESEKIENGHEGILVKMVVKEVFSQLTKRSNLTVPAHLVGIDKPVEHIMSLIDAKFDDTSIVGIYGMGGIGKTVLARVLYNVLSRHFENLSYLADIRETSQRKDIQCLQKQLISDILRISFDISNVQEGIDIIKSRFTSKKVLVLLDDVDDITQLRALCVDSSWFEAGSIVIITTRNKSILDKAKVGYMYKLRELSSDQSLILFSRHAFEMDYPQTGYENISRDIVRTTDGLPLALEVIGSLLRGKTKVFWEEALNKLKEVPHEEVQAKLKISYEALDHRNQQIFLDVACFFIGSSKQSPTYMWDSCGFFPSEGIEVLSLMSLIEVDKDGKFMMHDQMRNFAREIVYLENPKKPQERSRLWDHEDAIYVLDNNKGTSKIKALRLDEYSCRSFKSEQFKELTNLRFLQVNGVNFTGDFQNLLPQLRWLQWQACPSDFVAANFHPKELVVLNLSWSGISEDWGGWDPLKVAIELRVLNLSHCHFLRRTPNLSAFERLEILILEDCDNLEEIHSSIGDIKTLISLNVKRCGRLEKLPEQIGSLTSLTQLDVSHSEIKELPESIGFLKKLNTLDASYCASLAWIPSSIGHLASLQHLLLQECCSLKEIPDSIEQLESLIELHLKSTEIVELPQNIRNLQELRILEIRGTGVAKLPGAISHIDKDTESMANVKPGIANESEDNEPLQCQSDTESMVDMKSEIANEPRDKSRNWKPTEINKPLQCQSVWLLDDSTATRDIESMANVKPRIADESGDKSRNWKQTEIDEPLQCSIRLPDNSTAKMSFEKIKDEAGRQPVDMGNSDKSYAIASVQKLVGIDDRAKQIIDLLEMEVNDEVRIIGIYGTDGIGKTTLAKAVYDEISSYFDSCSFLVEVDETTQNSHDIRFSQTKLIRDILTLDREDPSSDERIEIFVDIFRKMKVLIVVDGVQNQSHLHAIVGQLDWFGPGSRIIVTSQNEEILKEYDPEKTRTYMVSKLDDGQAFELFCKHAHTMTSQYGGLAYGIVNATEKLPLAVEVVGSFLRGRSIQEWKKMEKSMSSQKTTVGLQQILDICYKELDQQRKDIFLDIACFISGVDARIASYMWPSCYLPSSGCILMPLAKIGENNELQMHRLLRCLGKRVFKQEESQDPSSRRFCTQDMVLKAMNREKGVENVEARDACTLTAANFVSMPAISFLKLDDAKVHGDFTGAFPSLRWFHWQRVPLDFGATNFVLTELVIFDLSWSKVTEDWRGWSEIKMEKLKVLNLTGCSALLITPDFSGYKKLEMLILERCSLLMKLDSSIGHLKRLVSLNLKFCSRLDRLPVELGCTTALKELFIDGTSVQEIPISIGNLRQLEILSGFKCSPLTHLPSSLSCLTALTVLSLDGAKISELPSSLGELLNLRHLSLRDCRCMQQLPDSIGKMGSSLEELDISATSISKLPDSMRDLQNLRVLRMDSSFIRAFPEEIGNLTKLEELHSSWCRNLKGPIPRDIKRLHHLRSLTLRRSSISSLPSEISAVSSLHTLDLLQCNEIEVLPELPPSLICLRVSSKRMKTIPRLNDLKELEELYLSDEDPEKRQPPSKQLMPESKAKLLSIWFSRLWNLELLQSQRIFLISFPKLRKLELSLSRIVKLKFVYQPTDIPQLKTLTFSGLSSAIEEIEGLEGLKALKRLEISNCKIHNLNGIGQLTSLRSLILSDCDDLSLPDLSNLKSLKVLEIRRCKMIHQIKGLEKLSLEKRNISECPAKNAV